MPNAWNYKLKHKQPTKKEERDFIKNLSVREKQYSEKPLRSFEEMWGEPVDWNGVVYYTWYEKIWRKLLGKGDFDK